MRSMSLCAASFARAARPAALPWMRSIGLPTSRAAIRLEGVIKPPLPAPRQTNAASLFHSCRVARIPGHGRPWLLPRQAIEIFWQVVFAVFVSEPRPPVPDFKQIEQRYWPLVLAMIAARYLSVAKEAFPPALAVGLYMEAAISMSKIDPGSVKFASGVLH